jgi:hypothetical protein
MTATEDASSLSGSTCPICQSGALTEHWIHAYPGSNRSLEFVCDTCGSEFMDHTGVVRSLELVYTRRPDLPRWKTYAHQALTSQEWKALAGNTSGDTCPASSRPLPLPAQLKWARTDADR